MQYLDLRACDWDYFAARDCFFTVLSYAGKEGRKWSAEEFFETGENEITDLMAYIDSLGITLSRDVALDFGCGVGRLTQPLARYFDYSYGVDISERMIEAAQQFNQHGSRCRYLTNRTGDLRLFADGMFALVYSNIVLQHIRPRFALRYVTEFIRVARSGGIVIFQVPSESALDKPLSARLKRAVKEMAPSEVYRAYRRVRFGTPAVIERHCIPRETVLRHVGSSGGRVLDVVEDRAAGPDSVSFRYCVLKE